MFHHEVIEAVFSIAVFVGMKNGHLTVIEGEETISIIPAFPIGCFFFSTISSFSIIVLKEPETGLFTSERILETTRCCSTDVLSYAFNPSIDLCPVLSLITFLGNATSIQLSCSCGSKNMISCFFLQICIPEHP